MREHTQKISAAGTSEELFHTIFDHSHDALVLHDHQGKIIAANPQMMELFRLNKEEVADLTISDCSSKSNDRDPREIWNRVVEGAEETFEWLARRPSDGFIFPVKVRLKRIPVTCGYLLLAAIRDLTADKIAAETMRETERHFREIFENISLPAVKIDFSGKILFINDYLLQLTGWHRSEVIGRDWFSLFIPPGQEATKLVFDNGVHNDTIPRRFQNDIVTRSGERRFISWTNTAMKDPEGRIVGVSSIGEDLTESKQAEQLLVESEQRYSSLFESNQTPMMLLDPDTLQILSVNAAAVGFYGYSADELLQMNVADLSCSDGDFKKGLIADLQKSRKGVSFYSWHRVRTGGIRDVEIHWSLLRLRGKRVIHGIIHDITERKATERALQESQERFRQVFDQNDEAIILARAANGEILYANQAVLRVVGAAPEDFIGRQLSQLIHYFPCREVADAIETVNAIGDILLPHVTRRGPAGDVVVSIRLRLIRAGTEDLIHVSFRNITDRIRLEEEAKAAQARLIHANKLTSLGVLVAGMAHEINNPNNFIMFNSTMLVDIWQDVAPCLEESLAATPDLSFGGLGYRDMKEAVPKLLDGLVEGSRRIKGIIDNLRQFSRQDSGARRLFDINEAILKATAILTPQIRKHTECFALELAEDLPKVRGKQEQIEQVIINLAINALQSLTKKTDRVVISTRAEEEYAVIEVRDEGCGMDVETLTRVSEPFFTTKNDTGGTGLGIFISQSILSEHGASIEYDSMKGGGTTAVVRMPIADSTPTGGA